jgi:hypothetical protein
MKLKSNKNNNQSSIIDNQLEMPSTSVEKPLQISPFSTNKANVKIDKMNLSLILLKGYEDLRLIFGSIGAKNKPNSNPIKANFGPISRVAKPNKPNSNAKESQMKSIYNIRFFSESYNNKCFETEKCL